MDAATGVGVCVFLLISYMAFLIKRATAGSARKPPAASGGWPLIGHLHLLGGSGQPLYETLGTLADKYGPIFSIRIGVHPAVVVSSWELAKECFTTLDVTVSSRPKFTAAKILTYNYASFAFAPYGDFWRDMHKITVSELLSTRQAEMLRGIRDSEVKSSLRELQRAWAEKRGVSSGDLLVEMKQWFGEMNLNVILRMVAGKRYCVGSVDQEQARRVRGVLRDFFHLMGSLVIGDAIPFLGWLDLGGEVKEMKKTAVEIDNIVSEWLEEHKQLRRDSSEAKTEQDFMGALLSALDGVDLAGYDADTVIKATCSTLIAAATDTTTVTMIWTLSLLLNNRHALNKVQDELDEHVGKGRLVNESDINKLIYLQAVVKETMRLYAAAPLPGPREFTSECTLGGYRIQAGTRFILNIWKMQRDPRVWSDPLEFQPERFLTNHKGVDVKGQHFELLPFGGGRRSCPGMSFALQMTYLALATFLQAFEVTTLNNENVDMSATFGLTLIKTTPLEVLAKPRLPYQLFFTDETKENPTHSP
ncbi:cytochrome P450 CYP82D47-like [Glycine soja]|uniref:Cytochrome P450 82A1 n=1 Tax=Glycine soja TaxID=3848 RepID=A0A445K489_GLYSO|nr:cytochrome P450 CYP82D47-like [Glycine soja]RZC05623.1 Cytochrome P450 82A1 [Glycine soja]